VNELGQIFNIVDRLEERKSNLSASAGTNLFSMTAVPAGEFWVLQGFSAVNVTNAVTSINGYMTGASCDMAIAQTGATAVNIALKWTGALVMAPGDYVRFTFGGCTLNDDLYVDIWGYKMMYEK